MWQDSYVGYSTGHDDNEAWLTYLQCAAGQPYYHPFVHQYQANYVQSSDVTQAIAARFSGGKVAQCVQKYATASEEETKEYLWKIKQELEHVSWNKLEEAQKIASANEVHPDLETLIERAMFFLGNGNSDSSPIVAVDALRETTTALMFCKRTTRSQPLFTELDGAAKKVRDTLTVRAQLKALPIGDKKKYQSVLKEAYAAVGFVINDEENSRLMQSYRKVIWEQFADAFPSNNRTENLQRNGPRPRRERPNTRNTFNLQGPPGLID